MRLGTFWWICTFHAIREFVLSANSAARSENLPLPIVHFDCWLLTLYGQLSIFNCWWSKMDHQQLNIDKLTMNVHLCLGSVFFIGPCLLETKFCRSFFLLVITDFARDGHLVLSLFLWIFLWIHLMQCCALERCARVVSGLVLSMQAARLM